MTSVRTRRDRTGRVRVYVHDILIGSAERVRTRGATGRRCTRWRAVPARAAYTLNRIGAPIPGPAAFIPLPAEHTAVDPAVRALVEHLRAAGAPAVAPAYGARRA